MRKVTPSGLVVAAVGFLLTRSTVTFALTDDVWGFVFAGLVPLVLGLGLAALGVALAVGSFEPWYVRTSAIWCCIGFLSMFVLVVLTVVGTRSVSVLTAVRADPALSNVLIGGSVGGTLTGMYAARTRRERHASRNRANRLVVLNRILREEVINAVTVIRSRAELLADDAGDDTATATAAIVDYADRITETIENIEYLTWTPDSDRERFGTVDVATAVEAAVETTRERHPDAEYEIAVDGKPVVHANERLTHALYQLLENAVTHTDADVPEVTVSAETLADGVRVRVSDNGPGLPDRQRRVLEAGEIAEYDDPNTGFGLNVVRLLVESFGGTIDTEIADDGTTVVLTLVRADAATTPRPDLADIQSYGVAPSRLVSAVGAALLAGATMGVVLHAVAGVVPVIGALYGVADPVVGFVTHEFHSVVFGLAYAAMIAAAPARYTDRFGGHLLIALAWAGFLWLFAAGVVMPAWLRLVGIGAALPNVTPVTLLSHAVWGSTLAAVYYVVTAVTPGGVTAGTVRSSLRLS